MKKHVHSGQKGRSITDVKGVLVNGGLREGDALLDLGCGGGDFSLEASKIVGETGRVYALDSFEESVKNLEAKIKSEGITNIVPLVADAVKEIPLPQACVSVCLLSNVLHGFAANEELGRVMNNLKPVLKPGARLIAVDFKKTATPFGPPMEIRLSEDEMKDILARHGFFALKTFNAGSFHYGITFRLDIEPEK